jgi:hypothetical protein
VLQAALASQAVLPQITLLTVTATVVPAAVAAQEDLVEMDQLLYSVKMTQYMEQVVLALPAT